MEHASPENDSKLVTAFGAFGDICTLNVLWILTSIPVFTIGASTTALYSVMLKIINKEEGPVVSGYFKAFSANFKSATKAWLVVMLALVGIGGELLLTYSLSYEGFLASFYMVLALVEIIVLCLTLPFLFPLIAKYDNTLWNTFKNSFLLAVSNLWSWVKVFLAWFVPVFVCVAYPVVFYMIWYLWLILIFGLVAYGTSFTIRKVLQRVTKAQQGAASDKEEEKNISEARSSMSICEKAHLNSNASPAGNEK